MIEALKLSLRRARCLGLSIVVVVCVDVLTAAAPAWLLQDAGLRGLDTADEKGATILRSENVITISSDGSWQQLYRYTVRIDRAEAANFALMGVPYIEKTDEIQRADAWLVRQGKTVQSYPRKQWIDRAEVDDATLYSDFRSFFIGCPIAVAGDIFGGEVQLRQSGYLGQRELNFSFPLPARVQRLEVRAPKGWRVSLTWLNGKAGTSSFNAAGNTWVWEILDQPDERSEVWAPEEALMRAALTVIPPAGAAVLTAPKSWQDVAVNLADIQGAQCDSNADLAQTASRLTAGLSDPWKKIQALTAFVQNRRYIAVNRNNGLGFGYRPRKATEVLAADYGDCKDKSNLLRALLREAGFRAYLVAAYVGNSDAVRPEWASPTQFNHAVIAVEVPSEIHLPATVDDPVFGHLLFFDSTVRRIPAGHLPWVLQGGWGLICDPRSTGLVKFPADAVEEEFKITSKVAINLDALGGCSGEATETAHGQLAVWMLDSEDESSSQQKINYWTQRLVASIGSPTIDKLTSEASADGWRNTAKFHFSAVKFGQPFRNGMRLFNIDVLWPDTAPLLPDKPRQHDLLARPINLEHEVSMNLPPRAHPELPSERNVQSLYGRFKVTFETAGDKIICRRVLTLNPVRVLPDKYPEYRRFFADIVKAERIAILVRSVDEVPAVSPDSELGPKSSSP